MDPQVPTVRELAGYFLVAQHPASRMWVDDDVRLGLLAKQRADDVLLASDMDVAALRSQRFAPGHPAEALLNRWLAAGDDLNAMMSMRYENGDPSKPFVDATVSSRPFTSDDVPELASAARRSYGILTPRFLRLWSSEPAGSFAETRPDKRFLAAPIRVLREGAGPALRTELRLTPARSLRRYELARAAYEDVDREHPAHSEQAQLEDYEDLETALLAGNVFDIMVDGEWAGYSAVTVDGETLGMPAYIIQELIMISKVRGRGYGPHLTSLLALALPDEAAILLGTIHADNRGARRAAEAAGRIDVGGWIQVPL
jgi:hypothetical protein